ncbi:thioesterase II family protein [Oceanirhabdus sp. W0125-5]|uniref:thioesterase II family protein n=1 Tax=Oceanirhabdus sp. W0125-5 TaxID=2999116 RepID=UPI0022F2FF9D|nr:thioesterase domain-containing protein [Oceanirhabdus sp. W0125-5]WBW96392.1 thioesterase domain-containing protein [Oceanirhabdus sp. W0125-5]
MILFCLPYAGGSEAIYYNWKGFLSNSIELHPIELKGRGRRYNQEFYTDIDEAVNDIYNLIKEKIEENEYAIYGHSMGSLLAYELYYKIASMGKRMPKHIFFSGYSAPGSIKEREITYTLPDYEFMNKIIELGGTQKEILENKELLELFIPILRNDIKILEKYKYKDREEKINCDISILNGSKDSIKINEITEWRNHTSKKCNIYTFTGNHFFINDNAENITNLIKYSLVEV